MNPIRKIASVMVLALWGWQLFAQGTPTQPASDKPDDAWAYSLTLDGYIVPGSDSYASPVLTADHRWLHLEARYNYENLHTGSLWVGYNLTAGKTLQLAVTPMLGGVFGDTTGIAPGCEFSLTYKKIELSSSNEFVYDTSNSNNSFYYSWPELTYSPVSWFRIGGVAEHTRVFHTSVDTQRGFLVGVSFKKLEFTTYVLDPELPTPTTVLEVGYSF